MPIARTASATGLPWAVRTSTCRSLATICSGVLRFPAMSVPSVVIPASHSRRTTSRGAGHEHRSVPEIHAALRERGVAIAERSVTNLLDRYDELLATALTDTRRLRRALKHQGGVILALDGLQQIGRASCRERV